MDQTLPTLEGKTADQILRGDWFGLSRTMADKTEQLLADYRRAVENREDETKLEDLRQQVREKVGVFAATPVDELAQEIAGAYRQEFAKSPDPETRRALIQEAIREMRKRALE